VENARTVTGEPDLRELIGPPKDGATAKIADRLNDLTRRHFSGQWKGDDR